MPEDLRWNAATLWAGPKCHIVHYPLQGWKVFNLVVTYHNDAPEPVAGKPVADDEVMRASRMCIPRAQAIIRHGSDWRLWVLCDREPVESWVDGRVALLGDAAHPMLQYMAQGACMAMEDAVCLAHMLSHASGRSRPALEAYRAAARRCAPRGCSCSRAPSASTSTTPPARMRALRNAVMRAKSSGGLVRDARLALWRHRAWRDESACEERTDEATIVSDRGRDCFDIAAITTVTLTSSATSGGRSSPFPFSAVHR